MGSAVEVSEEKKGWLVSWTLGLVLSLGSAMKAKPQHLDFLAVFLVILVAWFAALHANDHADGR